uniref:endonuclease/exonuclease/phosphatase family protein n=1 Tax=Streptomyces gibsoniae TaxID=3075529 RepID=UPI00374E11A2
MDLLGDLNGTTGDGELAPLTSWLHSAQAASGAGFGFTYPASFPVVRVDQILLRGVDPHRSWVLPTTGSDHLAAAAGISW